MKTFAIAKKINPAFKVVQPLPLWPVRLTGRESVAVATDAAKLHPTQTEAQHKAFDLAACAMSMRQDFCRGVPLTN